MYYIGLDVHKQKISYCVKDVLGKIRAEGWIPATRFDLDRWMKTLPQPWSAAMEATMFSGWIYDHLKPHAAELKVAHPLMLRAIAAAKKKNDRIDANKICDCFSAPPATACSALVPRVRRVCPHNPKVRQPGSTPESSRVSVPKLRVTLLHGRYNNESSRPVGQPAPC
jgi:transposase